MRDGDPQGDGQGAPQGTEDHRDYCGQNRKVRTTTKTVVVASGDATLSAGTKRTLTLTLNSTGRALLAKVGKLKAVVTVSSGGKTIKTVTVTVLKAEKPKEEDEAEVILRSRRRARACYPRLRRSMTMLTSTTLVPQLQEPTLKQKSTSDSPGPHIPIAGKDGSGPQSPKPESDGDRHRRDRRGLSRIGAAYVNPRT